MKQNERPSIRLEKCRCRDCNHFEMQHKLAFLRVAPPRCANCGGILDIVKRKRRPKKRKPMAKEGTKTRISGGPMHDAQIFVRKRFKKGSFQIPYLNQMLVHRFNKKTKIVEYLGAAEQDIDEKESK